MGSAHSRRGRFRRQRRRGNRQQRHTHRLAHQRHCRPALGHPTEPRRRRRCLDTGKLLRPAGPQLREHAMKLSRRHFIRAGLIFVPAAATASTIIVSAPRYSSLAGPTDSPDNYSGVAGWYRSMDLTTLADNDPVSTWTDRTSNHYDATGTGTARPTFKTNILNGKPALRFDGNDVLAMQNLPGNILSLGNFTIIAVLIPTSSSGYYIGR